MYRQKKHIKSNDALITRWANMYESLSEQDLNESTTDEDIINTAFSTLLYFLCGEGNKVLKDTEWLNYLENDLNTAIEKGLFKPSFEDKQHIKMFQDSRLTEKEEDSEDSENDSDND